MALEKERSEQTQWYTYLEQEREELSTSVEATLAESGGQEDEWDEEEIEDTHTDAGKKTSLIPPRLSLQSKVMPAVQAAKSATLVESAAPSGEEQQKVAAVAEANVFMRLARRLTSSFAAFGVTVQPEATPPPFEPPLVRSTSNSGLIHAEARGQQEHRQLPAPSASVPSVSSVERKPAGVEASSSIPAQSSVPLAAPARPSEKERRKLAGTTKVRLETTPMPAIHARPATAREQMIPEKPQEQATGQQTAHPLPHIAQPAPSWEAPHGLNAATDVLEEDRIKTSMQLPIVTRLSDVIKPASAQLWFGTGSFESGECDKMIADEHVTATCVVNVTLTDNPGPVVVHYVSMHPGIGFTVHLTAPTNAKTSFTYVILSGAGA
jgi:hypothetical protein